MTAPQLDLYSNILYVMEKRVRPCACLSMLQSCVRARVSIWVPVCAIVHVHSRVLARRRWQAELSRIAQDVVAIDKFRPESCCVLGAAAAGVCCRRCVVCYLPIYFVSICPYLYLSI